MPSDFGAIGKIIGAGKSGVSPYIRRSFSLEKLPANAELSVTALGFFVLYINGKRVGDDFYKPVWSDYEPRKLDKLTYPTTDTFTHRVYYLRYDVTAYLKKGKNVVVILLGGGPYCQKAPGEGVLKYGDAPYTCFELFADGMCIAASDAECKWEKSHIAYADIYYGEVHRYRRYTDSVYSENYDDSRWEKVILADKPELVFCRQEKGLTDVIERRITPALISKRGSRRLYDAGENISGFATLETPSKRVGRKISVCYAETLKNGKPNYESIRMQRDVFLHCQKNMTLEPCFNWKGYRYVEIKGNAQLKFMNFVHADVKVNSSFKSDNALLNWLYDTFVRTTLSNMHAGVPSDCPHREKRGYTGDGQIVADAAMLILDSRRFYEKWMRDIADCQDTKSGHVQHTAPFSGGGGGPGGWGGAIVVLPYQHYKHYGEAEFLRLYYPNMLHWVQSMLGFSEGGLVVKEYEGGWCLGEWCTPGDEILIPEPFVNTVYFVKCLTYLKEIAAVIGESPKLDGYIKEAKAALMKYYDKESRSFCCNVQGANAFAAWINLDDEVDLDFVDFYKKTVKIDTGMLGTPILFESLRERGEYQLVFNLLTSDGYPSFKYLMNAGATTFWEYWNGKKSQNHPMFGACVKELFYTIFGVQLNAGQMTVNPPKINGLRYAECDLNGKHYIYND